jgi:hypothetical protein
VNEKQVKEELPENVREDLFFHLMGSIEDRSGSPSALAKPSTSPSSRPRSSRKSRTDAARLTQSRVIPRARAHGQTVS